MLIAVDARFLQATNEPDLTDFTKEVYRRLWCKHAEHQFILFTDNALEDELTLPENVSTVALTPKPTNFLLYKWWYDVALTLALKKYKADVFIATYGFGSLTSSIPQVSIVRDLTFLHQNKSLSTYSNHFCRKTSPSFLKKAAAIATLSNSVKEELGVLYHVNGAKMQTVGSGVASNFHPVEWHERELIKEQFADGCEYFVFSLNSYSQSNFLPALKAFSIFKKWQKSNMKMVVIGVFDERFGKEMDKLKSYKFNSEVFIKKEISVNETSAVVAGSYAFIFPTDTDVFPMPVLQAMACGVPVITGYSSSISEIAGDTALYANPLHPAEMAEQMKKIYKDEQLRSKLVEDGISKSKLHTWDNTSALLWKVIQEIHSQ